MLSGGFSESIVTNLDACTRSDEELSIDAYGYESDSDLDDEEIEDEVQGFHQTGIVTWSESYDSSIDQEAALHIDTQETEKVCTTCHPLNLMTEINRAKSRLARAL